MTEILGGSYKDLEKEIETSNKKYKEAHPEYTKNKYERHHIFAQNAFKYDKELHQINKDDGPVIKMKNEDHKLTMSNNKGKNGERWRNEQSALLQQGNYKGAWDKGIQDIRQNCGTKYDQHINQAENQLLKRDKGDKIKLDNQFKRELEQRQAKLETKKERIQTEQKSQQSQQTQKQVFSSNQNLLNQQKDKGRGR